jgi:hypothetical protein
MVFDAHGHRRLLAARTTAAPRKRGKCERHAAMNTEPQRHAARFRFVVEGTASSAAASCGCQRFEGSVGDPTDSTDAADVRCCA